MQTFSRYSLLTAIVFVLNFGSTVAAFAQNYAVDWHVIGAGGGTSANAAYEIIGTAGQSVTGHSEYSRYAIDSGFWGFTAAVQMPGAPLLTIRPSSANALAISWPSPSTGFVLQSATDLTAGNWENVDASPADDGVTRTIVVPQAAGHRFFRLIKSQLVSVKAP